MPTNSLHDTTTLAPTAVPTTVSMKAPTAWPSIQQTMLEIDADNDYFFLLKCKALDRKGYNTARTSEIRTIHLTKHLTARFLSKCDVTESTVTLPCQTT